MPDTLRLGLIGDNIAASRSPRLHEIAGAMLGRPVRYERLVPAALGLPFEAVVERARAEGFRGLNITYPYKERVVPLVSLPDARLARLGAVNTVLFEPGGPVGRNTDHSGAVAAIGPALAGAGPVCLIGAGGAGRAIAFALADLGCPRLRLCDTDPARARAVAAALAGEAMAVEVAASPAEAATGAAGFVNATPVGMVGHEGIALDPGLMAGGAWAFDAVYTPPDTPFLRAAAGQGLRVVSGWELYFHQGLHCVGLFHGTPVDAARLRAALLAEGL